MHICMLSDPGHTWNTVRKIAVHTIRLKQIRTARMKEYLLHWRLCKNALVAVLVRALNYLWYYEAYSFIDEAQIHTTPRVRILIAPC